MLTNEGKSSNIENIEAARQTEKRRDSPCIAIDLIAIDSAFWSLVVAAFVVVVEDVVVEVDVKFASLFVALAAAVSLDMSCCFFST